MTTPTGTSVESSLAHIARLRERIAAMTVLAEAAEEQVASRVGRAYAAGDLALHEAVDVYLEYRAVSGAGFSGRWNANVPKHLYAQKLQYVERSKRQHAPNSPDGSWWGRGRPPVEDPCPIAGQSVVYVLYGDDWTPVYVGSTGAFRLRLRDHALAGKPFVYWRAWPCRDRAHAYQREAEMLAAVMPTLNRRQEGRRSA